jgi:hypothetical protein
LLSFEPEVAFVQTGSYFIQTGGCFIFKPEVVAHVPVCLQLEAGAHVDVVNSRGQTPMQVVTASEGSFLKEGQKVCAYATFILSLGAKPRKYEASLYMSSPPWMKFGPWGRS